MCLWKCAKHLLNASIRLRLISLGTFISTDIGVAIYGRYVKEEQSRVSYSGTSTSIIRLLKAFINLFPFFGEAHFFGALVGFLIGVNTLRNLKMRRWEIILGITNHWASKTHLLTFLTILLGWVFLVLYALGMGFAILFNLLNHEYFVNPQDPDRCKFQQQQDL